MNEIEQLAGQVREAQLEIRSLKSKLLGVMEGNGISASAIVGSVSGSGYQTVQDEGTPLTQRTAINFVGAGVVAADSGGVTTVTIAGGAGTTVATDTIWDALGDTVYGSGADTGAKLAGNITTTRKFLRQVGNGAVSAAPAWDTIADADVPATHSGSAHHAAVTLNAAADTVLGLSTQQITLDTQTANLVWAGPTSGGAATPTFRSLVAADIPDISATYVALASANWIDLTDGGATTLHSHAGGGAHNLLSATHTDTLAGSPVRGDLAVANSTPAWTKLAAGAAGTVLIGGTDPSYSASPTVTSLLATTALVLGAATTAGVRLDIESGALAAREGDDSAYVDIVGKDLYATGNAFVTTLTATGNIFVVNVLASGYLRLDEIAAPTTPAAGLARIYAATDSTLHFLNDGGVNGRVILTTDTDYIDLTDGGATTLHSHSSSGSVATDTIWDAAGDLVVGTGADTAARLPIGAASTVLISNGTTASWSGSPQLTAIKDTGGTDRVAMNASGAGGPSGGAHVALTGITEADTIWINTALSVGPGYASDANFLGIFNDTTSLATRVGIGAYIGTGPSATTNSLTGVAGKAVGTHASTTAIFGLDFAATATYGATVKTLANIYGARVSLTVGSGTNLTISNAYGVDIIPVAYSNAGFNLTTIRMVYARGGANARIGTSRGVQVDSQTATITANNPFYDTGLASTRDADGNRFRSNTQFGSVTGAFGTGDGVIGIADRTTAPSTNPAGGGVLYSNAGAGTWRGSGGTVTAFAAAGPHCGVCGYDSWATATLNSVWETWLFVCANCNKRYEGGPPNVISLLDAQQKKETLKDNMEWDDVQRIMGIAA